MQSPASAFIDSGATDSVPAGTTDTVDLPFINCGSFFDSSNIFLGSSFTVFPGAGNSWTKNGFVGIVATGGDDIGRVTLYNNAIRQGVDDVTAYGAAVPEPSTVGLMGLGCLLLGWMRYRKKAA